MLKLYNTLTRDKQEFSPIVPGEVRLYVCGMTVYDLCHLGHARVMVVFDMVTRWLAACGLKVTYVRNITDIDDKIIRRAAENKEPIEALTARFIQAMHEDAAALGVRKPDFEPRATEYIAQMQEIIGLLEQKGLAYAAPDGDVNYSVRDFSNYGRLSGKSLEALRAGERVAIGEAKRDPLDFVLWKHAKEGEPAWASPWGSGRPGWHIECSAMASALLGKHFDIHGGGQDLQFPHHENEIAQSEGAFNEHGDPPFVNYWMHNGFVRVIKGESTEKMSKSLGNFFTVRDILAHYDAEVVRFFILRAHYRSPLNYSEQHMEDARQSLSRLYTALKAYGDVSIQKIDWSEPHAARFREAMNDDFNTPEAVAVLFELANEANRGNAREAAVLLKSLTAILGLLERDPTAFLQGAPAAAGPSAQDIQVQIEARIAAKKAKDYAAADRIREELLQAGIVLEDSAQGTLWRRR